MTAIFRRELRAYFSSLIGYIYLTVFFLFTTFYFFVGVLLNKVSDLTPVFSSMLMIALFLIPILTMRLLSEDRKYKTDQALLTAPVSLTGLVMGKFLAAALMFFIGLCITLVQAVVVAIFVAPNWLLIFGDFIAFLLLGMAFISLGIFISSLTENQVVAAIGAFAATLVLLMVDSIADMITVPFLKTAVGSLSFFVRYNEFMAGKFDLAGIVFFLSVSAVFLFLTVRVLEKRRWS